MKRIQLTRIAGSRLQVHLDGRAIGRVLKTQAEGFEKFETGGGWLLRMEPRWIAYGPGRPQDFADRVQAIRHLVAADAEFQGGWQPDSLERLSREHAWQSSRHCKCY
jgi:hypothetical protein